MKKLMLGVMMVCISLVLGLSFAGCKTTNTTETTAVLTTAVETTAVETTAAAETTVEAKKITIAFVVHATATPTWGTGALQAIEDAQKKNPNLEIIFTGPESDDTQKMISIMEDLTTRKVDGIAITVTDPKAMEQSINKAIDAGIPVVTSWVDVPDSKRLSFIGQDMYTYGVEAAKLMAELLKGEGLVSMANGVPGMDALETRIRGFKEYMEANHPGIKMTTVYKSSLNMDEAIAVGLDIIRSNPTLKGMYSVDGVNTEAFGRAIKESGNIGKLYLIGSDLQLGTLQLLKEGAITYALDQGFYKIAETSINVLYNKITDPNFVMEPRYDTGVNAVDKSQADKYLPMYENQ